MSSYIPLTILTVEKSNIRLNVCFVLILYTQNVISLTTSRTFKGFGLFKMKHKINLLKEILQKEVLIT